MFNRSTLQLSLVQLNFVKVGYSSRVQAPFVTASLSTDTVIYEDNFCVYLVFSAFKPLAVFSYNPGVVSSQDINSSASWIKVS